MRENKYNLSDEDFAKESELLILQKKLCKDFGENSYEYRVVKNNLYKLRNPKKYKEERVRSRQKMFRENPEKIRGYFRKWKEANLELCRSINRKTAAMRRAEIPEKISEINKKSREKNKEKINRKVRASRKEKYDARVKIDSLFKFKVSLRGLIRQSFKRGGWAKGSTTQDILGVSFEEAWKHLIATGVARYGAEFDLQKKYHIDHIIPIATANCEQDVISLNHYTNLQLLTIEDNLRKGAKTGARAEAVVPFIDFKVTLLCPEGCG